MTTNSIAVIQNTDNTSFRVVKNLRVGVSPLGITINRFGTKAYVTNSGDGTVSLLDTASNIVLPTYIRVGPEPAGIAVSPNEGKLFVSNFGVSISIIDLRTNAIANIPVSSSCLAFSPDGSKVIAGGYDATIIDAATNAVIKRLPTGRQVRDIAINSAGTVAFMACEGIDGGLIELQLDSPGYTMSRFFNGISLAGIAISPFGNEVYVSDEQNHQVLAINTTSRRIVRSYRVGNNPRGLAIDETGTMLFVANYGSNSVSIINLSRNMVSTVNVESGPYRIATGGAMVSDAIMGWGYDTDGELGDGTNANIVRSPVTSKLAGILQMACGESHTLALHAEGSVLAFGSNVFGMLGTGNTMNSNIPTEVHGKGGAPLTGIVAVAAGTSHSLALDCYGEVLSWGLNSCGQLGRPVETYSPTPTHVPNLTDVRKIACGENHTLALKHDGTVWAWGFNIFGQLGNGNAVNRATPIEVHGLSDIVDIAGGQYHSVALKKDGTVWAWGLNQHGQLGDGTVQEKVRPVMVQVLSEIISISCGSQSSHTAALRSDGTVWTWGANRFGQLGDGTATAKNMPVKVPHLLNVDSVVLGRNCTIFLKEDTSVLGCGDALFGQLGTEYFSAQSSPVDLGMRGVRAISGGPVTVFALR
ncbi:beta-propeller fold lactonase family protein [Geomonas sp.]|uniref:RCC1 domain-containing protein n=1 Tax=Geomonas sp. TaxID=2651584 RepID=UPI002B49E901|nr:beta-propeller fold lactonase family protein [Geomonas sp.]